MPAFIQNVAANVAAGLVLLALAWLANWAIRAFSKYTVVVVDKSTWEAFQKVAPNLHAQMRSGTVKFPLDEHGKIIPPKDADER